MLAKSCVSIDWCSLALMWKLYTAYATLLVSYRHFTLQTFNDGANGTDIVYKHQEC